MSKKTEKEQKALSKHAAALAKQGAKKGGHARANVLTPEHRQEIARAAVRARWIKAGKIKPHEESAPQADEKGAGEEEASASTRPHSMFRGTLTLGSIEMECHVLSDGRRVFTKREVVRALSGGRESGNLQRYLDRNPLTAGGFGASPDIEFDVPGAPTVAIGAEATGLVEICDKYLEAREKDLLKSSQIKLAKQAEIILRSCAKVGIIALIDEATGYQKVRARNALQLKIQAFIADEIQDWARMFPEEFWLELARLEGVRYSPRSRPLRWGRYVMIFVYDAIDSDVGQQLRKRNPNPRFLRNHHQWLKQFGREKVHDQITRVITIMRLCKDMNEFRAKFAKLFEKNPQMDFFDDLDFGPN